MKFKYSIPWILVPLVLLLSNIYSAYDPTSGTGGGGNVHTASNNTFTATNQFNGPVRIGTNAPSSSVVPLSVSATNILVAEFYSTAATAQSKISVGNGSTTGSIFTASSIGGFMLEKLSMDFQVQAFNGTAFFSVTSPSGDTRMYFNGQVDGNFLSGDATSDLTTVNSFRHLGGVTSTNRYSATATLDFPSTISGGEAQLSITVTGTASGDESSVGIPFASAAGGGVFSHFTSNNTVWIRFSNPTLGAIDPASGTFRGTVWKY